MSMTEQEFTNLARPFSNKIKRNAEYGPFYDQVQEEIRAYTDDWVDEEQTLKQAIHIYDYADKHEDDLDSVISKGAAKVVMATILSNSL